jgi:hypothetical protein
VVLAQDDIVLGGVVLDAHEPRRVAGRLEALGDDRRDDLPAVRDLAGLEHREIPLVAVRDARRVALPEHGEDAGLGERLLRVDVADRPLRDRGLHDRRVGHALDRDLVRVVRLAGDLEAALDAVDRRADRADGSDAHRAPARSASVRTSVARASGTL